MGLVTFTEPFTRLTNQGQVIMDGSAMSKSKGNLVNLQDELAKYGPDAVRVTMLFAGPPEDDIDWADVSPTGAVKWLARVWRLGSDVGRAGLGSDPDDRRRRAARRRAQADRGRHGPDRGKRFNVTIARLMELTSLLRKAVDGGALDDARRRAARYARVPRRWRRMLSVFAPFTAEEAWSLLGREASVVFAGWPAYDESLAGRGDGDLRRAGRGQGARPAGRAGRHQRGRAARAGAGRRRRRRERWTAASVRTVIVRAPKLVNVVPE